MKSFVCIAALICSAACAGAAPDTIIINAKIFTANPARDWVQALAISGERVVAVGDSQEIAAMADASTRRIDAGGRTVIPGLNAASVRLSTMTPDLMRALVADAYANGVTSMQALARPPIAETVRALAAVSPELRVKLFRMPQPQAGADHLDSRPYFPPQPSPRLDVRGMAFDIGADDQAQLDLVTGWAYGTEDPLSIRLTSPAVLDPFVDALVRRGSPAVWTAKRPRLEGPIAIPERLHARLKEYGVIVVQRPSADASLRSLIAAGIQVALSAEVPDALAAIAWATMEAAPAERISAEDAVRLMTAGAAVAEFTDREKGALAAGHLADVAVLSADVFTAPQAPDIRSVLTMIGGRVVRSTGVVQ